MPRLPRVYIENILYYITSRSGHTQPLFVDVSDYQEYISLIANYKKQYGFKLFSYCLMPAHLHMLIELRNNISISSIMHDINSLYTKAFNSRYNKKGHLFQARFKAVLAEKKGYLLPFLRHMHLNPIRAKICDSSKDYPHSSYSRFVDPAHRGHPDMKEEIEEVFCALGGQEKEFIGYTENVDQKELNDFKKKLHRKNILGSQEFTEHIKILIQDYAQQQRKQQQLKKIRPVYIFIAGIIIIVVVIIAGYFYRQSSVIRTKYQKTLVLYDKTIDILRIERDKALKANMDTEQYEWKIKLAEKALERAKQAREIEGYTWNVELTALGDSKENFIKIDILSFKDNRFISYNLREEGFLRTNYTASIGSNEKVIWETMQTNKKGETASWRGEWDGKIMTGVLRRRRDDGAVRDFSFASRGERIKR